MESLIMFKFTDEELELIHQALWYDRELDHDTSS